MYLFNIVKMSKRPNKQKSIDIIFEKLKDGITYGKCLEYFVKKWSVPQSTFSNYWKEANERFTEHREAINEAMTNKAIDLAKKHVERKIMTRFDILEQLTKIALGEHSRMGADEYYQPTAGEQIRAMETINRMQGYNEADKLEVTEIKPILTKRMSKK